MPARPCPPLYTNVGDQELGNKKELKQNLLIKLSHYKLLSTDIWMQWPGKKSGQTQGTSSLDSLLAINKERNNLPCGYFGNYFSEDDW